MKISVFGNCQAAILRTYISKFGSIDSSLCPLNYEVQNSDRDNLLNQFDNSDFIFVQRLSRAFPIEWIRIDALRERYGSRLIVWPNIYFDGFYPDIRYLYWGNQGKVIGPLGDYHFDSVLKNFLSGVAVDEAHQLFLTNQVLIDYPNPIEKSFSELRRREIDCDVSISDYIESLGWARKFQYTPNHPNSDIMLEMCSRLCSAAGLKFVISEKNIRDDLTETYVAPHPCLAKLLNLNDWGSVYRGVELAFEGRSVIPKIAKYYEAPELIERFYECYSYVFKNN